MIRVAFDIGGTFTDFVLHDGATGATHALKVPTTRDPGEAVLDGLEQLLARGRRGGSAVGMVLHATTVATNAVLERKGAATGLITTARLPRRADHRPPEALRDLRSLYRQAASRWCSAAHISEVAERVGADGTVVTPLDREPRRSGHRCDAGVRARGRGGVAAARLRQPGARAAHPRALRQARARICPVSLSSEMSPKFREYERTSTTVTNAYVKPIVERYLRRLEEALAERGYPQRAVRDAVERRTDLARAGARLSRAHHRVGAGRRHPDVRRRRPGRGPRSRHHLRHGRHHRQARRHRRRQAGHHADLRDRPGALQEGQRPADQRAGRGDDRDRRRRRQHRARDKRHDRGRTGQRGRRARARSATAAAASEPTITDANVVLGYIDPDWFNGGAMRLDAEAAAAGIKRTHRRPARHLHGRGGLGHPSGRHLEHGERAAHRLGRARPRSAALCHGRVRRRRTAACGAAGARRRHPHGHRALGAGVGSAIGLLEADPRIDVDDHAHHASRCRRSRREIADDLRAPGDAGACRRASASAAGGEPQWSRYAQMRYAGQGFEIHVDLPGGPIGAGYAGRGIEAFNAAYMRKHKFLDRRGHGRSRRLDAGRHDARAHRRCAASAASRRPARACARRTRQAWFPEAGGYVDTRSHRPPGAGRRRDA